MTGTEVSTAEMLLANLNDHKVVRIEGSVDWCQQLYQRINQLPNLSVVKLEGNLSLPETKMRVSTAIAGGSISTLIWLDPDGADAEVLSYLFSVVKGAEHSGSIVLLLKNSHRLDILLSEVNPAIAYADGYYQEEARGISKASSGFSPLLPGAVLAIACAVGGAIWFQSSTESGVERDSKIASDVVDKDKPKKVYAWSKPEPVSLVDSADDNPSGESIVSTKTVVDNSASLNSVQKKSAEIQQERMLADFSTVLDKEKSKEVSIAADVGELDAERQVTDVTPRIMTPVVTSVTTVAAAVAGAPTVKKPSNVVKVTQSDNAVVGGRSSHYPEAVTDEAQLLVEQALMQKKEALNTNKVSVSMAEQLNNTETIPMTGEPLITTYTLEEGQGVISKEEQVSVVKVVDRWARAWAAQDWDNYIDSYIAGKPYGIKVSLAEWREFRKDRLVSPEWVLLKFGQPVITVYDPHWVKVELYQRFEKPGYADETTKRLELKRTLGGWKIASEATDGTVVLSR